MMVAGGPSVVQVGDLLMPGWFVQSWGSTEMMLPRTLLLGETGHGKEMEGNNFRRDCRFRMDYETGFYCFPP